MVRIILAVDPDSTARYAADLAADLFTERGHAVTVAGDGAEAWPLVQAGEVDILVAEMMLPYRDGIELAMALRKKRPRQETGIILIGMISAEVGLLLAWRSLLAEVDGILIKPYHGDVRKPCYRPLHFGEQMVISVAHQLARLDLPDPVP